MCFCVVYHEDKDLLMAESESYDSTIVKGHNTFVLYRCDFLLITTEY